MDYEIWKPITNCEGYEVSSVGRVRHNNKILKPYLQTKPHSKRVVYSLKIRGKQCLVHRLVALAFLGESNLTVNHINGNTLDNRVENLEWCTLNENIKKGYANGLFKNIQKPIKLINKTTGKEMSFRSISEAERYIGKSYDYFSKKIKKNIYEDNFYKWELLDQIKLF